jgi:UDP-N-acetylglucosamine enolpyruvyl transferase
MGVSISLVLLGLFSLTPVSIFAEPEGVIARRSSTGLTGVDFQTRPYPGFATDLQVGHGSAVYCGRHRNGI